MSGLDFRAFPARLRGEVSIPCFQRGGQARRLAGEAFQRVCRFVSSVKAPVSHRSKNAKMLAR